MLVDLYVRMFEFNQSIVKVQINSESIIGSSRFTNFAKSSDYKFKL